MQSIKAFIHDHPHMWWGLFLPVYLALFFTIEHFITDNYWATQLPIDYKIPFLEGFAPFYASWSVLLCILGIYLIIKDGEGFRRYMWSIMVTFLISTLICALIPNGQDLRPAVMPRPYRHRIHAVHQAARGHRRGGRLRGGLSGQLCGLWHHRTAARPPAVQGGVRHGHRCISAVPGYQRGIPAGHVCLL